MDKPFNITLNGQPLVVVMTGMDHPDNHEMLHKLATRLNGTLNWLPTNFSKRKHSLTHRKVLT